MKNEYCATLLQYGSVWVEDDILDSLLNKELPSNFGGHDVVLNFYRDGQDLMVKWKTKLLIPENTYYIDAEINAEVEGTKVVGISGVPLIVISGVHNSKDAKKIRRV